jgi:cytochrome c oxidase subunit 2
MALYVVAEAPDAYEQWAAHQREPAASPANDLQTHGRDLFTRKSCALCHAINGTPAQARHAPDLTHVASRMTLGAGTLANNASERAAWILDPQRFKPGTKMPSENLAPEEIAALNAYLGALQ